MKEEHTPHAVASLTRWLFRRLDILAPLRPVRDIRLSGQVIYTGTSSMEVAVKMEAIAIDGREETLMLGKTDMTCNARLAHPIPYIGRFSMVCRNARTRKAYPVNSLVINTPEEEALYKMGESWSLDRIVF